MPHTVKTSVDSLHLNCEDDLSGYCWQRKLVGNRRSCAMLSPRLFDDGKKLALGGSIVEIHLQGAVRTN
jgi:hypothetical protein